MILIRIRIIVIRENCVNILAFTKISISKNHSGLELYLYKQKNLRRKPKDFMAKFVCTNPYDHPIDLKFVNLDTIIDDVLQNLCY